MDADTHSAMLPMWLVLCFPSIFWFYKIESNAQATLLVTTWYNCALGAAQRTGVPRLADDPTLMFLATRLRIINKILLVKAFSSEYDLDIIFILQLLYNIRS